MIWPFLEHKLWSPNSLGFLWWSFYIKHLVLGEYIVSLQSFRVWYCKFHSFPLISLFHSLKRFYLIYSIFILHCWGQKSQQTEIASHKRDLYRTALAVAYQRYYFEGDSCYRLDSHSHHPSDCSVLDSSAITRIYLIDPMTDM